MSSLVGILCTTQNTKIKTKLNINAHETLLWIHFEPIANIEKVSCPITGIRNVLPNSVKIPVRPRRMKDAANNQCANLSTG